MTDNKQELLSVDELLQYQSQMSCGYLHYDNKIQTILQAQVAKLKAMGYEQVWTICPDCIDGKVFNQQHPSTLDDCPTCKGTGKITNRVKWDRELVANMMMTPMPKESLGQRYRFVLGLADQLKEILTGGKDGS